MSNVIDGEDGSRTDAVSDGGTDLFQIKDGLELLASYKSIIDKDVRLSIKDFLIKISRAVETSSRKGIL